MTPSQALLYGAGVTILAALAIISAAILIDALWFNRRKIIAALRGEGAE